MATWIKTVAPRGRVNLDQEAFFGVNDIGQIG